MKQNIKCCDVLPEIIDQFDWFSFNEEGSKVLCMPILKGTNFRVNYCPSCGKEIRGLEIR